MRGLKLVYTPQAGTVAGRTPHGVRGLRKLLYMYNTVKCVVVYRVQCTDRNNKHNKIDE